MSTIETFDDHSVTKQKAQVLLGNQGVGKLIVEYKNGNKATLDACGKCTWDEIKPVELKLENIN